MKLHHSSALLLIVMTATSAQAEEADAVRGTFAPLNAFGADVSGDVSMTPGNGGLEIGLDVEGLSPGMHLAHVHGFAVADPGQSTCPGPDADANGDGYVDLIETRDAAGVTMIPLTDAPASLEIQSQSYPTAQEDGSMTYRQTVDLSALAEAVSDKFGTPLALERRVVFIHGAPAGASLPDSVRSLEGVPASVTIPIACAELGPVQAD